MENAAVFLYQDKQVLILRKSSGLRKGEWASPGGHIEWGETPKQAAIRELEEETGIIYHRLNKEETIILQYKNTRIYVNKIKKFPDIKLSEEHDASKIVNIKDIKKYNLSDYFLVIVDHIIKNKII